MFEDEHIFMLGLVEDIATAARSVMIRRKTVDHSKPLIEASRPLRDEVGKCARGPR